MRRIVAIALCLFATAASAAIFISSKRTEPPSAPASPWTFVDLGAATGTSGSVNGTDATMTTKGSNDWTNPGILYQMRSGDTQLIVNIDGFTGGTENFASQGLGFRQDPVSASPCVQLLKHRIGRISAKWSPDVCGTAQLSAVGQDTDTDTCFAAIYDQSASTSFTLTKPNDGDCDASDTWTLKQATPDVVFSGEYASYLHSNSADNATTTETNFSLLDISDTITIAAALDDPDPPQCADTINNDPEEDSLIDLADPGCDDVDDDSELDSGGGEEPPGPPVGEGADETFNGNWRTSDTNVFGWYWELPPIDGDHPFVAPATRSGIYNFDSNNCTDHHAEFRGNHLKLVDSDWKTLQPNEGSFDETAIDDLKTEIQSGTDCDGVMFNLRGFVERVDWDSCSEPGGCPAWKEPENFQTAPTWVINQSSSITESKSFIGNDPFQVVQVDITENVVKNGWAALLDKLGDEGVFALVDLKFLIIHGPSHSRGEEWSGKQTDAAGTAVMLDWLDDWADAMGVHIHKAMWPKHQEDSLLAKSLAVGAGQRNSNIENYLIYKGGGLTQPYLNMRYRNAQGTVTYTSNTIPTFPNGAYLEVDESFAPIAENRGFQDQNEIYQGGIVSGLGHVLARRYRQANLMVLHHRRNNVWLEDYNNSNPLNPRQMNWVALELGKQADTAPDAWVQLSAIPKVWQGNEFVIKNLERWLYQRDMTSTFDGSPVTASTTTHVKQYTEEQVGFQGVHGHENPVAIIPNGPWQGEPNHWYTELARKGANIGIAVDEDFIDEAEHPEVWIVITYLDDSIGHFDLKYIRTTGAVGTRTLAENQNTGRLRSAIWKLTDFTAPANGMNFDFMIESPDVPIVFVRLIKGPIN